MLSTSHYPTAREPQPEHILYVREGDAFQEASIEDIIASAQNLISERIRPRRRLLSPPELKEFLRIQLAPRHRATFAALLLDHHCRMIAFVELFEGTVDIVDVPPREVVRVVIQHNAGAVVFARSVACGRTQPSDADEAHYRQLRDALALIDVRVLDYLVIGETIASAAGTSAL
jgi:DNA repair protein RadC